jgi:hypothetical protein
MSITEVPVLPFRASRHLAAWIVWHTSGVSWVEDSPTAERRPAPKTKSVKRRKRRRA